MLTLSKVPHFQSELHGLTEDVLFFQWHKPGAQAAYLRSPLLLFSGGGWIGPDGAGGLQ